MGRVITVTGWTIEEFYQQPMKEVLDLAEHWLIDPPAHVCLQAQIRFKPRKKDQKGKYENEEVGRRAGMLPSEKNTVTNEISLPPWVRQVRQIERAKKMAAKIKGTP